MPDGALDACAVANVHFLQQSLEGLAVQLAVAAALSGEHLVLQLRAGGGEAIDVQLVAGVQVFGLGIVHIGCGLGDFNGLAVGDLGTGLDAHAVQPLLEGLEHARLVELGHHILPVVDQLFAERQMVVILALLQHEGGHVLHAEDEVVDAVHVVVGVQGELEAAADAGDHDDVGHGIVALDRFKLLHGVLAPPGEAVAVGQLQGVHEQLHVALLDLLDQLRIAQVMLLPEAPQRLHAALVEVVRGVAGLHARRVAVVRALAPGGDDLVFTLALGRSPGHGIVGIALALDHEILVGLVPAVPELHGGAVVDGRALGAVVGLADLIGVDRVQPRVVLGRSGELHRAGEGLAALDQHGVLRIGHGQNLQRFLAGRINLGRGHVGGRPVRARGQIHAHAQVQQLVHHQIPLVRPHLRAIGIALVRGLGIVLHAEFHAAEAAVVQGLNLVQQRLVGVGCVAQPPSNVGAVHAIRVHIECFQCVGKPGGSGFGHSLRQPCHCRQRKHKRRQDCQ